MIETRAMPVTECNDAELVAASLAGNRDAFGQIVARYQSLICSLAYSATGSLGQSEDLAQETFITAWKHLGLLRETAKLRAWLCGIARNRIKEVLRREGRQALDAAEPLELANEVLAGDPLPSQETITREEEAILWRALKSIPEIYREPLVLYYREHESVQGVAEELEISEEAARQRLSRGRKLLQEQVLAFVEGALQRTKPGKGFTLAVLAALPLYTTSAAAATIAATAAKGSAAAKAAASTSVLAALAGPLVSFLGLYANYRAECDLSGSARQRATVKRFYRLLFAAIGGFMVLSVPLTFLGKGWMYSRPGLFLGLVIGLVAAYVVTVITVSIWYCRECRRMAGESAMGKTSQRGVTSQAAWEYRSRWSLLGWPLVHIRIGGSMATKRQPVKAWIAVGEVALGGLFAFGGLAVAPLAIGGVAFGAIPFGGCAIGAVALGGFSLGWWSFGGCAVGWLAFGGCALGWKGALGSLAVAREFALGAAAYAREFNNGAAQTFAGEEVFFRWASIGLRYLAVLNLLWIVPMLVWWRTEKRGATRSKRQPALS